MVSSRLLAALLYCGRALSPLYSLAMRVRAALYARGALPSTRLTRPVISVGNLTMGGTGKTPMVCYLARLLSASRRPGIVSRGYGGRSRRPVNLVSDGRQPFLSPAEAGDEPVLLARLLPGVPVVTARRRALGGRYLVAQDLADVLILDDGFQHLALQRDLDLVLFSADAAVQTAWVFPGGMLREPRSALHRADCFVLTGADDDQCEKALALRRWLHAHYPKTPIYQGRYEPVALYDQERNRVEISHLQGLPLFAFCGLANPQSFRRTLMKDFTIKGWQSFADHHPFSRSDLNDLASQAAAMGCTALITTEKDFVKLKDMPAGLPLWVLAVQLRMEPGFDAFVLSRLAGYRQAPGDAV